MQSPPFPRYLVPPRSKYSPQHHVLKHPQLPFLPQYQRPSCILRVLMELTAQSNTFLYICSSVRRTSRLNKSNKMQQYADIYLLLNYPTCFGRPSRPSSGVHKTVVAASGTDHTIWEASLCKFMQQHRFYFGGTHFQSRSE